MPLSRFRLPASGSAAVSPAFQSYTHNQSTRRPLPTSDSTALADQAYTPDAADHSSAGDSMHLQFVSDALATGTIFDVGNTIKAQIQGFEPNNNCNQTIQLWVGVYSNDGATLRQTLLGKTLGTSELPTALTNRTFSSTVANAYTTVSGDRLVVEIGTSGTPAGGGGVQGHNATLRWGSDGSSGDLAENTTETGTTFNPWFEIETTPGAFELDAAPGSYIITGMAATLLATRLLNAEPGAYITTGVAATLLFVPLFATETDWWPSEGMDEAPIIAEWLSSHPSTAQIILNAEAGSYSVTGIGATLEAGRLLNAEAGSYTLTGLVAALLAGRVVSADPGSYAIVGLAATLLADRMVNAEAGAYVVTGQAAELLVGRMLNAGAGVYAVTGSAAELVYALSGAFELNAEPGVYLISGANAELVYVPIGGVPTAIYIPVWRPRRR